MKLILDNMTNPDIAKNTSSEEKIYDWTKQKLR